MRAFPPPQIVTDRRSLQRLAADLQSAAHIAVDTESNSLYAYREQVCLVQISTRKQDYVVDPLALDGLEGLGGVFANPAAEKVFHAAEYDIMCLKRDFGFHFDGLFDTMLAARILGWEKVGLGSILEDLFGIEVNKRYQRANWGRRPLPDELVRYAQFDTHYLLPLRDLLYGDLAKGNHLEEAADIFTEVCAAEWSEHPFDPEHFWKLKGTNELSPRSLAVLRELYIYREEEARRRDVPVFKIMSGQALVALAVRLPRSSREMAAIHGISRLQARRFGIGVLDAITRGRQAPLPERPRRRRWSNECVVARFEALYEWRKERARQRDVMADVIVSKDTLWEIAQVAPRSIEQLAVVRHLGPWRCKTYGEDILRILAEVDDQNGGEC